MNMMNKLVKKGMGLLLILSMLLLPISTLAAPVIGNTPDKGKLTITKTDGTDPLAGAEFTLYKIMDLTPGSTPGEFAEYTPVSHYASVLGTLNPAIKENYSSAAIEALVSSLLPLTKTDTAGKKTGITGATGKVTVDPLDLGYYLVVETTTPGGYVTGKPFFVSIPSTDNYSDPDGETEGKTWVYDVEVEPKNEEIDVTKEIKKGTGQNETTQKSDTVSVGDNVEFVVNSYVPEYEDKYFVGAEFPIYKFSDKMSSGLKYNKDLVVTVTDKDGTETTILPSAWDYETNDDTGFVITFNKAFLQANRGFAIKLEYSAKVTEDAVVGKDGNTNEIILEYSNDPDDLSKVNELDDKVIVYTFEIDVEKFAVAGGEQKTLAGAKFGLYKEAACTTLITPPGFLTTDASGKISFKGFKAGIYYLKEEEAPKGYKLLANPIKIEIIATLDDTTGEPNGLFKMKVDDQLVSATSGVLVTRYNETGGVGTIAVENHKGFTLPDTGGLGIAIFLVVGLGGIILCSVMVLRKKKNVV